MKKITDCLKCKEGYYCEPEGQTQPTAKCPQGYFCPAGTGYKYKYPCPVGFYRNASSAISSSDCSKCFAGMYCNEEGLPFPKICPKVGTMLCVFCCCFLNSS